MLSMREFREVGAFKPYFSYGRTLNYAIAFLHFNLIGKNL
jgi:hypothetical protein